MFRFSPGPTPFGKARPAPLAPKQPGGPKATVDAGALNRVESGRDFEQDRQQFMSTLDGLKAAGYMGGGGSSSSSGSASAGGGAMAAPWTPMTPGAGVGGGAPRAELPNAGEAGAAAFGRAKDRVGQSARGLMSALSSQFAERGLSGSSIEGGEIGRTLLGANQQLADVAREEAIKESDTANEFARARYQGDIAQRGQDADAAARERALALGARGQDISAAEARAARESADARAEDDNLDSILGLWGAFGGRTGRSAAGRY